MAPEKDRSQIHAQNRLPHFYFTGYRAGLAYVCPKKKEVQKCEQ